MISRRQKSKQNLSPKLSKKLKQIPANDTSISKRAIKSASIKIDAKTQKQYKSTVESLKRQLENEPKYAIPRDLKPMLASITGEAFNNRD